MEFKIERILFWLGIVMLAAGVPWIMLHRPDEMVFVYRHAVFTFGLFGSIPLTILVTLALRWTFNTSRDRLFWITNPAVTAQLLCPATATDIPGLVRKRLAGLGFAARELSGSGGEVLFDITKAKADAIHSFIDHAFRGTITLRSAGSRSEASVYLTFVDTLIIETGEFAKLRALAAYLAGTSDSYVIRQAPFTLITGATLALANLAALADALARGAPWADAALTVSIAAASLCAWGLAVVIRDRANLEGIGLGAVGIGAAGVPYLMLL